MAPVQTKETLYKVALTVAIIGAINWGLVGFFNFNLVDAILGGGAREETSTLSRIVYAIVGVAGLLSTYFLTRPRISSGQNDRSVEGIGRRPASGQI